MRTGCWPTIAGHAAQRGGIGGLVGDHRRAADRRGVAADAVGLGADAAFQRERGQDKDQRLQKMFTSAGRHGRGIPSFSISISGVQSGGRCLVSGVDLGRVDDRRVVVSDHHHIERIADRRGLAIRVPAPLVPTPPLAMVALHPGWRSCNGGRRTGRSPWSDCRWRRAWSNWKACSGRRAIAVVVGGIGPVACLRRAARLAEAAAAARTLPEGSSNGAWRVPNLLGPSEQPPCQVLIGVRDWPCRAETIRKPRNLLACRAHA